MLLSAKWHSPTDATAAAVDQPTAGLCQNVIWAYILDTLTCAQFIRWTAHKTSFSLKGRIDMYFSQHPLPQLQALKKVAYLVATILALAILGFFTFQKNCEKQDTLYADIAVANYGTITVALAQDDAPQTVDNFVSLAQSGFYDGLTFHRIIDGFMIQGGDPNGDGTGGSDQCIPGEFSKNGIENSLSHTRGAVSMARSEEYDSASSQFFIVQQNSTYLDGSYAVFGYVVDGMYLVDQICADAKPLDNNGSIAPEAQPVITSIIIRD